MSIFEQIKNTFSSEKTKTVYRFVSPRELDVLQEGKTDGLGVEYYNEKVSNNHKYIENESYIHFFDTADIPERALKALSETKRYLCEFEIDKKILSKHKGLGFYPPQGYAEDYTSIKEYAVPISEYNSNWFVGATPIETVKTNETYSNTPPVLLEPSLEPILEQ